MTSESTDLNKPINRKPRVISAKIPVWFFDVLEEFKKTNELKTRNSAIEALLIISLKNLGFVDEEKKRAILNKYALDDLEASR